MARLLGITRFWNYISDWIECRVHLRPEKDGTLDLGSSDYQWRRVYVGPGSVSAPAVLLAGDSDTGIYQSAADNLDVATGGTNRLNISSTGLAVTGSVMPSAFMRLGPGSTLTVSSGGITVTGSRHYIDTESGGATDDLYVINGGATGDILVLSSVSYTKVTTLKDSASGSNNLRLAGDFALSDTSDMIMLMRIGANWHELSRSNN